MDDDSGWHHQTELEHQQYEEECMEKHVYKAISEVQGKLSKSGVSKDKTNKNQGYKFRGIDDMYNALAPFLSESGLCILPRVLSREVTERQSNSGGALFYVTVEVEFDIVAANDSSCHTVKMYGEAMDSGDKATNKAMSAAYKYMAMEVFCIPTEGDNDADSTTHEVKPVKKIPESQKKEFYTQACDYLASGDEAGLQQIWAEYDTDEKVVLWGMFNSQQRSAMKKLQGAENVR